ncbi:MAG: hypothetical protein H7Y86_00315, partial [Rhizobacter sp.]|nr:hypothetical protein [Ferruginibacter sp.]
MRYILLPLLIISYNAIFAQRPDWNEIENSIGKKRNLYDLTLQLETIKQEALRTKNYPLAARCYWNLVLITDHKMEDSSYFKNSMSIDSVGKHISDPLLRSIMLVLKAKRISFYRHRFSYRSDKNLYAIPAGSIDYGRFSGPELDSLADMHLQQARAISITLTNVKVDDLLWLSTDPLLFLFTPVYTDIIFAEQLHTRALPSYNVVHNFKDTNWILSAPGEFISRQIPETDLNYPMFRIYRDWVNFNRHDSANFYFIESLAKKYFYGRSSKTANSTRLYETWLLQQLQSPHSIIRANTIYQLCTEWIKKGDGYTFKRDNYYNPEFTASPAYFDTAVRWHYVKALSLMENNSRLLDSFFYLKRNLLLLKDQVTQKKLSIINQSHYLPDEPIQLQSNFKNTDSIHFKVVKLNTGVGRFKKSNFSSDTLLHLPAFKNFSIAMPAARDYQEHSTLIDAGSLPKGYYAVLFSDTAINASMNVVDYFLMDVTNIAAINNDKRLFILHRKTGLPLNNASPLLQYTAPAKKPLPKPLVKKINADGYVIVSTEDIASARVTWGDDTSFISINEMENETPDELYDKDDYEDLAEYYEENLQIHLFTDRSIYRPGQTMHFKGMVFTRAPATGKMIPFHKKHLQFPALKKMFNADVKEFLKEKLEVFITDPFGKYADTIEVSVNEYGSFTGSYTISKDAATGDWDFDTDYVELNDRNDGHFKVEEYKRPTFELQLEKPAAFLQLGDSFVVKARLRSFAGALLNNVKLNYTIDVRSSDLRTKNSVDGDNSNYIDISIADSSGYTDNNGELLIKIPATFLPAYEFKKDGSSTAGYYLEVTAADATGESQQASLKVSLSNRPVNINYSLAAAYEKKSAGLISVTTKNEFAGEISRQLKVNIFRLDKKAAPGYAAEEMDYLLENGKWIYRINYPNGNDADTSLVYETSLLSNSGKLDLQKAMLPAGNYLVKITSNENGRIIGETARNFSVFDMEGQTIPAGAEDFYHLPFNSVAKGETIKWYYGTTKNDINTIYHVQYFAKTKQGMRSEYLYSLQPGKTGINTFSFKIPADAAGEKIILTQLYIKDNDFFAKSVDLYLQQEASDRPEIIVERYRQKLTPGSKEKFSVSIKTRSEKIAAELMTVIYDASLDKIEPHEWRVPRDEIRYYPGEQWQTDIRSLNTTTLGGVEPWNYVFPFSTNRAQPMWWMNEADSIYMDVNK